MNSVINKYEIDLASNNNYFFVTAIQGDGHSTRYVELSILENQQAYIISEDVQPTIRGTKPDNNTIFNTCEIVGENIIRFEITPQMTAVNGSGQYEIALMSKYQNSTLTTFPFNIVIKRSSIDPNSVTSSNEFTVLVQATLDANKATENANTAADNTNKATADCRDTIKKANDKITEIGNVESDFKAAESIRVSNENTRISNEDARKQAETQRNTTFNQKVTEVNTAKSNAEKATANANTATTNANKATADCNTVIKKATDKITEIGNVEDDFKTAEALRVQQEENRQANENVRKTAETDRQTEFNQKSSAMSAATSGCNEITAEVQRKLANGEFNGKDGAVASLEGGQYVFQIVNDHLCILFEDGTTVPDYKINDSGHLVLDFTY